MGAGLRGRPICAGRRGARWWVGWWRVGWRWAERSPRRRSPAARRLRDDHGRGCRGHRGTVTAVLAAAEVEGAAVGGAAVTGVAVGELPLPDRSQAGRWSRWRRRRPNHLPLGGRSPDQRRTAIPRPAIRSSTASDASRGATTERRSSSSSSISRRARPRWATDGWTDVTVAATGILSVAVPGVTHLAPVPARRMPQPTAVAPPGPWTMNPGSGLRPPEGRPQEAGTAA